MSFDIKTAYKEPSIKLKLFVVMRDQINGFVRKSLAFGQLLDFTDVKNVVFTTVVFLRPQMNG